VATLEVPITVTIITTVIGVEIEIAVIPAVQTTQHRRERWWLKASGGGGGGRRRESRMSVRR